MVITFAIVEQGTLTGFDVDGPDIALNRAALVRCVDNAFRLGVEAD